MSHKLILDANILILLIVGLTDENWISRHKALKAYNKRDFHILEVLFQNSNGILVTPHILTEVDNLLDRTLWEGATKDLRFTLKGMQEKGFLTEEYVTLHDIICMNEYDYLGLSDTAILAICKDDVLISDDYLLLEQALRRNQKQIFLSKEIWRNPEIPL